jgi:hypothetical protein
VIGMFWKKNKTPILFVRSNSLSLFQYPNLLFFLQSSGFKVNWYTMGTLSITISNIDKNNRNEQVRYFLSNIAEKQRVNTREVFSDIV